MSGPADIPIGERVRFYRQSRQKTQAVVAGLAGVTEDYLSQIERGLKTPSTALLHRLARVLGVPTSVLFGESAAEPATPGHPLSAAIHAALASGGDGASASTQPDLPVLRERVHSAWQRWQGSPRRYSQTGPLLPELITDVQAATLALRSSPDTAARREAARITADLYFLLRTFTKRIGRTDLSLLVADRGVRAAQDADDPLRIAAAKWNLGQVLLATNEPEIAEEITVHAAADIRPKQPGQTDNLALYGALWLVAAIAKARTHDAWTARETLREHAAPVASVTNGNILWTVFGPTNVALHALSIEMESGEVSEALRMADDIDLATCPSIERRATFYLDLARCYDQRHDDPGVILNLLAAEEASSEDMRHNPLARNLVRALLRRARPSLAPTVRRLADRIDLLS